MEKRDSFVFYRSFYDAICLLEPEQRVDAFLAICEYALDGTERPMTGAPAAILAIARANLDANQRKYENGKKGGRPKKTLVPPDISIDSRNRDPLFPYV